MAFTEPSQQQLEQARDAADAAHKQYWSENGGSPAPETYFPGFERGWNDTKGALGSGNEMPGDLASWASQRAGETGQPENSWEWEHGFKAGAAACQQAGSS